MKKAQGLSLTTIVVAALALLVLVILSVVFVGRMGRVTDKSKECEQNAGICYKLTDDKEQCSDFAEGLVKHPNAECLKKNEEGLKVNDEDKVCCMRVGS